MSIVTADSCECPIFNADCFNPDTGGTVSGNYVEFPTAQGNTTVQTQTVLGTLKVTSNGIQTNAAGDIINIGTSGTSGRINLGKINAALADSVYVNSELRVYGTVLIDGEGIQTDNAFADINIGTTSAMNVNLGKTGTPTNVAGNLLVSSSGINATAQPLNIGTGSDYTVNIGAVSTTKFTNIKNLLQVDKSANIGLTLGVTGLSTLTGGIRTGNIDSILNVGASAKVAIGTVRAVDTGSIPAVDIGWAGQTVRVSGTTLLVRNVIDTISSGPNILNISPTNSTEVIIKNILKVTDKVNAADVLFTNNANGNIIDTDAFANNTLYIAPDTTIYPDAKCSELFISHNGINTTIGGGNINIGENSTIVNVGINADALNLGSDTTGVTTLRGYGISIGENSAITETTVNNQLLAKKDISVTGITYTNQIDTAFSEILYIGENNAQSTNIKGGELVVGNDGTKNYVSVDACYFITGDGGQATIDTKTPTTLCIAPSTIVEPSAICTGLTLGNDIIPVEIVSDTLSILVGGSVGSAGEVLTSNGTNVYWGTGGGGGGGTTVLSGETGVLSTTTGSVTYSTPFASKPKIMLTYNLNGTGTTIIPVAVLSHISLTNYTGFNWIAATTGTGTISWYAIQ